MRARVHAHRVSLHPLLLPTPPATPHPGVGVAAAIAGEPESFLGLLGTCALLLGWKAGRAKAAAGPVVGKVEK